MNLYDLMKDYAVQRGLLPATDLPAGELGTSLALFHNCLIEAGLEHEGEADRRRVTAGPETFSLMHLSRFVVGFLPFNAVSDKNETNEILFDLFSFLRWLDKQDIAHGLAKIDFQATVQALTRAQERCLQLSHCLDDESGRILEEPPAIAHTINDVFQVVKMENDFVLLQGQHQEDPVRIRLPGEILKLVRLHDHLDLVLGDTSERWVVLEAGQVFPEHQAG